MSIDTEIKRIALGLSKTLIAIRRDIHQHPELGFQEQRTSRKIVEILKAVGLDRVQAGVAQTGVVGVLRGARRAAHAVALRADMDALPITEENPASYRSQTPGVMHACGHDGHVALCLGAAMILKKIQARIPGSVKFIFQPAEEMVDCSGAPAMIRAGALNDPDVEAIFGMHVSPKLPYDIRCQGWTLDISMSASSATARMVLIANRLADHNEYIFNRGHPSSAVCFPASFNWQFRTCPATFKTNNMGKLSDAMVKCCRGYI